MRTVSTLVLCLALLGGCANLDNHAVPPEIHQKRPGYLAVQQLPDSVALIPPPPANGSTAFALDEEASRASFPLLNTARWNLAVKDADLSIPAVAATFSCALNAPIGERETPHLDRLMSRVLSDVSRSVAKAKNFYRRPRPFMVNGKPLCTPDYEAPLRKSGSYPSGHTAAGWAWALILGEVAPERADAVLRRGRSFGESRVVCNAHWKSDVDEGRTVAAAVVARLHGDPAFRSDLELARAELAALRSKGAALTRDCRAESEALALSPSRP